MKDKDSEKSPSECRDSQSETVLDIVILNEYHARKGRPKDDD